MRRPIISRISLNIQLYFFFFGGGGGGGLSVQPMLEVGWLVGWLVGCFGFNGPLREYFSLYQAISQREGERENDRRITRSNNPNLHLLQAQ